MIKEILAPALAFLCFTLIILDKRFFNASGISKILLVAVFSLKTFSAILYGYFYQTGVLTGGDTFLYFIDGNVIYRTLHTDPLLYLKLALGSNDYKPVPASLLPYTDEMRFWFDQSNYFIVRINALIRPFSFGVYNVHAIVFAFLSFTGAYNLYLFFGRKLTHKRFLQVVLFGMPSFVFWTSGMHKDAIVLFSIGTVLYNLDAIARNEYTVKNIIFILLGMVMLGYGRFYLLVFLLPLMVALVLEKKFKFSGSAIYKTIGTGVAMLILTAVLIDVINPKLSYVEEFLVRRDFFLNSPGTMTFQVQRIPHDFSGVVILLIQALTNPFIRPLPGDCHSLPAYLVCLETYGILLILMILLVLADWKSVYKNPSALFCILFGISTLFLVGLIVNNSGAIIRYRTIPISFILAGLYLMRSKNRIFPVNNN
ncbi:MAG: hypothetical protein IPM95_08405 [Sphingobacteriales bacterium]|nr:hypothetical protein [Sphingobacteriales bacterium]